MAPVASPSIPVDWRPYYFTAIGLGLAMGLNLGVGNRLWLSYSLVGFSLFLILLGLVIHYHARPPAVAVWLAGSASALHFVGGSLSGLHQIGNDNGLYFVFPWWDNLVHFLGATAAVVAADELLASRMPSRRLRAFLAWSVAVTLGVLVELYEFTNFVLFGTVDQGYYTNNLLDLYYNAIGAGVGLWVYRRLRAARAPETTPAAVNPVEG